jgi:hypothetical protein
MESGRHNTLIDGIFFALPRPGKTFLTRPADDARQGVGVFSAIYSTARKRVRASEARR